MEDISKEVAEKFAEQMTAIAKKHTEGLISEEKMNKELGRQFEQFVKDNKLEDIEALRKQLDEQGLELKSIKEKKSNDVIFKSFRQQCLDQVAGKNLKELAKSGFTLSIDLEQVSGLDMYKKGVGTISVSSTFPMTSYDTAWAYTPLNPPVVRSYSNVLPTTQMAYSYVDLGTREGGAAITTQGSAKTQSDATPVMVTKTPDKITSYWDFNMEALDDIPNFMAEMERELVDQINAKEDYYFVAGGTGIVGLASAPAFSATGIGVSTPGVADAIMAAATQIATSNFNANLAMMNPVDYANFIMGKDDVGAYLIPPFIAADGTSVGGVKVVQNNNVTAGYVIVGDFSKYYIRDYKTMEIRLGYVNANFKSNIMTAVGEKRVIAFFKTSHAPAFVYDAIADIKTAITVS